MNTESVKPSQETPMALAGWLSALRETNANYYSQMRSSEWNEASPRLPCLI